MLGPGGEKKLLATATFATVAEAEAAAEQVYRLDPTMSGSSGRRGRDDRGHSANRGASAMWLYKPLLIPLPNECYSVDTTDSPHSIDDPCHAIPDISWPRGSVQQLHQLSEVAERRIAVFLRILDGLPPSHKQLAILVFGILHQMVFHAASTAERLTGLTSSTNPSDSDPDQGPRVPLLTIAEGVVKSVAGTLFHTCSASVLSVEQTAQVLSARKTKAVLSSSIT
ncbi:unnamed protein product [Echinostoma caproni]|uniref:Uncharacterized protein n=1 Tax=Echinostoma caproni TaxID=27848 RepID=A0A3P8KA76_9TREM|nr:unnamed protein product [Echinostoma caproni]